MTHTHAKGQGHRSLGLKFRVEINRWTDVIRDKLKILEAPFIQYIMNG